MDNRVIDILKTVILQYGDRILTDSKRCRALLQDHCCGAYTREVKVIMLALEEGVVTDLRYPPADLPITLLGPRLVDCLVSERFLDRTAAEWTVRTWASALGVSLSTIINAPLPLMASPVVPQVATRTPEHRDIPHLSAHSTVENLVLLGIELIQIPAGDFLYGVQRKRNNLPAFNIMVFPVTVAQYRQFCDATGRAMPSAPNWGWQDNHPIVNVSWHDAAAFAEWVGLVLPTEEEWEKAARSTDGREYPWGNHWDASKCCNNVGQSAVQTAPVGRYPAGASPYGVQDMAGNMWEWCDSWFAVNSSRVLRGGGWYYDIPNFFRTTYRDYNDPTGRSVLIGFRCVSRSPGR